MRDRSVRARARHRGRGTNRARRASGVDFRGLEPLESRTLLSVAGVPGVDYALDRMVVGFTDEMGWSGGQALAAEQGNRVLETYEFIDAVVVDLAGADLSAAIDLWSQFPGVEYAEPQFYYTPAETLPNDPSFGQLWGLHNTGQSLGTADADIDAPEAWDITRGSTEIVIAVIDTGIDYNHPDLAANMWKNPGEVPGDGVDNDLNGYTDDIYGIDAYENDADPMDFNSHGTHCAGTIGAVGNNSVGVVGVNWIAKLMALKMFPDADVPGADPVEAIEYMTMMKTQHGVNIAVSSNSWGGSGGGAALENAIQASIDAGIIFIAAAGNGGEDGVGDDNDTTPNFPSNYTMEGLIAVAATDRNDQIAGFSNYGSESVDLGAPGVATLSTVPVAQGSYGEKQGTSMATPHVAGVAGLLASLTPQPTVAEIQEALLANVDPIPAMEGKSTTGGRLNAFNAVDALANQLKVVSTLPGEGDIVTEPPTTFVVDFNFPYSASTVQGSDFKVNNKSANGVEFTDSDTLTFHYNASPVTAQGEQAIVMARGSINGEGGVANLALYEATFRYDALRMAVTSVTPADASTVEPPLTKLRLVLNEPFNVSTMGKSDLQLSRGSVKSAVRVNTTTVEYTLRDLDVEGPLTYTLLPGALEDSFGNPNLPFTGALTLDRVVAAVPVPLGAQLPLGSLIYAPVIDGLIGLPGDTDSYIVSLDAGQQLTVAVAGLEGLVVTLDSGTLGAATAPAANSGAMLEGVIHTAGLHTITVGGDAGSTGAYELRLVLNALAEAEPYGGTSNNTLATAQNIDASILELIGGTDRGGVVGIADGEIGIGPDGFGYEAKAVPFAFEDIRSTGTAVLAGADNTAATLNFIDLNGFSFPFYGVPQPLVHFNSNGLITFGLDSTDGVNTDLTAGPTQGAIAPFWDDLIIAGSDDSAVYWQVLGTGTAQRLVIQWNEVGFVNQEDRGTITFQAVLSEADSSIQFNYLDLAADTAGSEGAEATVGIKDTGTQGANRLVAAFNDGPSTLVESGRSLIFKVGVVADAAPDYYGLALEAGQVATVAVTGQSPGNWALELYNAAGNLVATGVTADNLGRVISGYTAPATGDYFARILGDPTVEYTLLVTRDLPFDTEPHNDFATAQPLGTAGVALGGLTTGDEDWYSFSFAQGEFFRVVTTTPGDAPFEPVNTLDPMVEVYDPAGNLVASDTDGAADGRNALLTYAATVGGTYRARVSADTPTTGAYTLGVGLVPVAISGVKFDDRDGDGLRDAGEVGLPGWTVQLIDPSDSGVIASTVTAEDGSYEFAELPPGAYRLRQVAQPGWVQTTVEPADLNLLAGQVVGGIDFGGFELFSLSGTTFEDSDGDGVKDDGEPGLEDWSVRLLDASNNPLATATTGPTGAYSFTGLGPGVYRVRQVVQAGWQQTTVDRPDVAAFSGGDVSSITMGHFQEFGLAGRVFNDLDGDGTEEAGETGLTGRTVRLFDGQNQELATTTTTAGGGYAFAGLGPGVYRVRSDTPAGWTQTGSFPPDVLGASGVDRSALSLGSFDLVQITGQLFNDTDADAVKDTGEPPLSGWTVRLLDAQDRELATTTTNASGAFTFPNLGPGTFRVREVLPAGWMQWTTNPADLTTTSGADVSGLTFGNFERFDLAGQKFNDLDGDGVKEAGEDGLLGWTIQLLDGQNNLLATTATSAAGAYAFAGLGPGTYRLREVAQPGWVQSTANPADITGASGADLAGADFGGFDLIDVSGRSFNDLDADGVRDGNELGLSGRTIQLIDGQFNVLATTTTAADGAYSFTGRGPGAYAVRQLPVAGWTPTSANSPPAAAVSGQNVSNANFGNFDLVQIAGEKFSDLDGDGVKDNGEPGLSGWAVRLLNSQDVEVARVVTDANGQFVFPDLGPGTYRVREVAQAGWTATTPDPADITPASGGDIAGITLGGFELFDIVGQKFHDLDGDAIQDPGEPGLSGWTIRLLNLDGEELATTAANASGFYRFNNLGPGAYRVRELAQPGWVQTTADPANIVGASGLDAINVNSGNFELISISGRSFLDVDGDGAQDLGEPGLAGRAVQLLDGQSNLLASILSGVDGAYAFANLGPGVYNVRQAVLPGWTQTTVNPATVTASSGADVTGALLGHFENFDIMGLKFNDLNGDGVMNTAEPGLAGWTIQLLNGQGNVLATTTTDADGGYSFLGTGPGLYRVREVTQAGWTRTTTNPADIAAASGVDVLGVRFGGFELIDLAGVLFADPDADGVRDANESGLAGWSVQLTNGQGDELATTTTDAAGAYTFAGLGPGSYRAQPDAPAGWLQTTPTPSDITAASGAVAANLPVGFHQVLLSIGDAMLFEGQGPAPSQMVFTITSSLASPDDISFQIDDVVGHLAIDDGTAYADTGADYQAPSGTRVIPAGITSIQVIVPIIADTTVEGDEEFDLVLSNAVNAAIGDDLAVGTILNDDGPNLIVTKVQHTLPALLVPGDRANVAVTLANSGNQDAIGAGTLLVMLSGDTLPDDADRVIGQVTLGALKIRPGGQANFQVPVTVPGDLPIGDYQLVTLLVPGNGLLDWDPSNDYAAAGGTFEYAHRFGSFAGRKNVKLTLPDPEGVPTTFSLKGPGAGQVGSPDGPFDITLSGTTRKSTLIVTTPRNSGTMLGDLTVHGALKAIKAANADLLDATWELGSSVRKVALGDADGWDLTVHGNVKSLKMGTLTDGLIQIDGMAGRFKAGALQGSTLDFASLKSLTLTDQLGSLPGGVNFADSLVEVAGRLKKARLGDVLTASALPTFGADLGDVGSVTYIDAGQKVAVHKKSLLLQPDQTHHNDQFEVRLV